MTNAKNVKNTLPIDMEFCFAIWISFARVSSNGKHFFHIKWQNVFRFAIIKEKASELTIRIKLVSP